MHDCRDQHHSDDGGVEKQGEDHAKGNVLHHDNVGKPERPAHHNHDDGCRTDNPAGVGGAEFDGNIGGGATLARLHHARHQEHLIVGGQPINDCHDEHQHRTHERAWGEAEQVCAHTIDEHPGE